MNLETATDKSVKAWFSGEYKNPILKAAMIGIYECRRAKGESVLDAYIYALTCLIEANTPTHTTHDTHPKH